MRSRLPELSDPRVRLIVIRRPQEENIPLGGNRAVRKSGGGDPRLRGDRREQDLHVPDPLPPDQLLHRPFRNLPSTMQHDYAVAEGLHVGDDVGAEEYGLAGRLHLPDQVPDLHSPHRVEPRHGFVEDHELRVVKQRLGQSEPLHHSLRVFPDGGAARVGNPHPGKHLGGPLPDFASPHSVQVPAKAQELASRQVFIEIGMLGHEPDPPACFRPPSHFFAEHRDPPRVGEREAVQDLDRRRLPGTVGAEEPDDLVAGDGKGEVREHLDAPPPEPGGVGFGDPFDRDNGVRGGHRFRNTFSRAVSRLLRTVPSGARRYAPPFGSLGISRISPSRTRSERATGRAPFLSR